MEVRTGVSLTHMGLSREASVLIVKLLENTVPLRSNIFSQNILEIKLKFDFIFNDKKVVRSNIIYILS